MKASVRLVSALVVAVPLSLAMACGGGGTSRWVEGAQFPLDAQGSKIADRLEQGQPTSDRQSRCGYWQRTRSTGRATSPDPTVMAWVEAKTNQACAASGAVPSASDNTRGCYTRMEAGQEGDVISATLRCRDSSAPIAGAKLQLNSHLTESNVDRDGPPDPEVGLSGNLQAVTDDKGQASFNLASVRAGGRFSATVDKRASILFNGDFQSGPRNEHAASADVDLSKCTSYSTWLAQAQNARGGDVAGVRQLTNQLAASAPLDKQEQVSAIAEEYCGTTVQLRMKNRPTEPSGGDGEVCFNVGVYFSKALQDAWARQQRSARYFETSCKLGFAAACSRPEITSAKVELERLDKKAEADTQRRAQTACAEATQCHQQCAKVEACIAQCTQRQRGCTSTGNSEQLCKSKADNCTTECARREPSCSLRRCLQLDSACDSARSSAGNAPSTSQGGAGQPTQQVPAGNACFNQCRNELSSCMTKDSQDYDACVRPCRDNGCQNRCVEEAKKRQHSCHERHDEAPCRSKCN